MREEMRILFPLFSKDLNDVERNTESDHAG